MSAFPYRTQAVRDLAWACFCEPLLRLEQSREDGQVAANCALSLTPRRRRWLEQLDRRPAPLLARLAREPRPRLGLYFEQLWQFFLEQDSRVDLVAHNLPVRDKGRTLGEFDIIYWCHERRRHVHLELAVKYYLGYRQQTTTESASHWHEWLGPNARDRLDLKLEQLLRRQIRLGDQPLARARLAALGIEDPLREIALRGYLFAPAGDPLPPPPGFNSRLPLARWLPQSQLAPYLESLPAELFVLLPTARWLSPAAAGGQEELIGRSKLSERLQSLLAASGRARLVAVIGPNGLELNRFFVTCDHWPAAARPPASERP